MPVLRKLAFVLKVPLAKKLLRKAYQFLTLVFIPACAQVRSPKPSLLAAVFFQLSNMMLGVKLEPELGNQIELRLQKVDVLFLVVHQLFE